MFEIFYWKTNYVVLTTAVFSPFFLLAGVRKDRSNLESTCWGHGRATPSAWEPEQLPGAGLAHLPWRVTEREVDFSLIWATLCYGHSVLYITPAPYLLTFYFKTVSFTLTDSVVLLAFTILLLFFGSLIGQHSVRTQRMFTMVIFFVPLEAMRKYRLHKYLGWTKTTLN